MSSSVCPVPHLSLGIALAGCIVEAQSFPDSQCISILHGIVAQRFVPTALMESSQATFAS